MMGKAALVLALSLNLIEWWSTGLSVLGDRPNCHAWCAKAFSPGSCAQAAQRLVSSKVSECGYGYKEPVPAWSQSSAVIPGSHPATPCIIHYMGASKDDITHKYTESWSRCMPVGCTNRWVVGAPTMTRPSPRSRSSRCRPTTYLRAYLSSHERPQEAPLHTWPAAGSGTTKP